MPNVDPHIPETQRDIPAPPQVTGSIERGDVAIVARCETWFRESEQYTRAQRERWRKNEQLKQNEVTIPGPDGNTKMKFNLAMSVIETIKPVIKDHLPTFDVMPEDPNDVLFADMVQKRKVQVCQKAGMDDRIMDSMDDCLTYSNGLVHVQPIGGKQAVDITVKDPFTWYPAPGFVGMDIARWEARYHIFATPMHVDEVLIRYKKAVSPEGYIDDQRVFKAIGENKGGNSGTQTKAEMALVKEAYFMDADTEAYPNGRQVMWCSGVLIDDRAIPYPRIPYFMIKNMGSPHAGFGMGEPELISTQVKSLNQVMSSIADNINKTGNPIRKILRSWWTTATKKILGKVAGEDVVVDSPADISWEVPPPLPGYIFEYLQLLMKLIDVVTGIHDVTEGRAPTGVEAASAIAMLQEAAQRRVRYQIAKDVTKLVQEIGAFIVWVLQNRDEEIMQIVRRGEGGEQEFLEYNPALKIDAQGIPQGMEGFNEAQTEPYRTMKDSQLEITVVGGTQMPAGRVATEERALRLFEAGIYGIEQVVQALAEPDKQGIIDAWYQRQGIQAMAERQKALVEITPEFEKYVDQAIAAYQKIQEPQAAPKEGGAPPAPVVDEWVGSLDEERLADILRQFPEYLKTPDFNALPVEYKRRLLMDFMVEEPQEAA